MAERSPASLSVVVPFFDSVSGLASCLDSLLAQTHPDLEVVLVDDGSDDGSAEVARRYARGHPGFALVEQEHRGVAVARDAGVRRATGAYLAFCDADDEVPPAAYARLVAALETSGSDLAVASVAIQSRGLFQEPAWAERSNRRRRLGASLADAPEVMGNLMPGARVFRRSFWDAAGCAFSEAGDRGDIVTVVRSMLAARSFDVLPAVGYRWAWREDGRSLLQRDLAERDSAGARLASMRVASELLAAGAPRQAQDHLLAQVLHSSSDLVRAAVHQDDGYWQVLSGELGLLMQHVTPASLEQVPVLDRVTTWLCSRNDREATEDFVEYAAENGAGLPFRMVGDRAHILAPVAESLAGGTGLTRVADGDMRFRTRLTGLAWERPGVLRLEGGALVEYTSGASRRVSLVLTERTSGEEVSVPARGLPASGEVNRWAGRAFEDHGTAGFEAHLDVASLPWDSNVHPTFNVAVRLEVEGRVHVGHFQSRRSGGSPGLLEVSTTGGVAGVPGWSSPQGLSLTVRPARKKDQAVPVATWPMVVDSITASGDVLRLTGSPAADVELALVGPRSRTPWVRPTRNGAGFTARLEVLVDEWGLGPATLPRDEYAVMARRADASETRVGVDRALWRTLGRTVDSGRHLFHPSAVGESGALSLRLAPGEDRDSRPAYLRRLLRDTAYPAARHKELLPAALFETFAGRSGGDNPGALCEELARRETGLDLAVSVVDRSVLVPADARAVVRWSPEWLELVGRARFVVTNANLPRFVVNRPGQVLLETWHGSPLKRIGHDRQDTGFNDWRHRRHLLVARESWDYLLSQSPFCTDRLRSAFRYEGEVLEVGYPRNDVLVSGRSDEARRRTREHLGIPDDARVILYAPTWRDDQVTGRVFDKVLFLDAARLVEQVAGTVVLLRGHYNSLRAGQEHTTDRQVMDVTRYPDISDLYLAADALVTDYSSVFFDFALTDKPMVFLAPDLAAYRDEGRGFYLDYHDTVPGPVCLSTDEVVDVLRRPDGYAARRAEFRREFTPHDDGFASRRVVDTLLQHGAD